GGEQRRIAPERRRPRLDRLARDGTRELVPVVHRLERPEATRADAVRDRWVLAVAHATAKDVNRHRRTYASDDAIPADSRASPLRLRDGRPAQARAAPRGTRRDRPRIRQPRHPVAGDRGGEARRSRAAPGQPPLLRLARLAEPARGDLRALLGAVRRRARSRPARRLDDRREGGARPPDVGARGAG